MMYNNQNGMDYRNQNYNSNGFNYSNQPGFGGPDYRNSWGPRNEYYNYSAPNQMMQSPQQQFQQPVQQNMQQRPPVKQIMGKWVDKEEDISPADVAMDGNIYLFPFSGQDVIVAKRWNSNGGIDTQRYILEQQITRPAPTVTNDDIMNRLQHIDERLDALFAPRETPRKQPPKKETEA